MLEARFDRIFEDVIVNCILVLPKMNTVTENLFSEQVVFASSPIEDDFDQTFIHILEKLPDFLDVNNSKPDLAKTQDWLKTVMMYNVPHGKKIRGRFVEHAFKQLVKNPSSEDVHSSRVLGWCIEMLQASFLIADDIMDNGVTRRGQPCWYRVNGMGTIAVNDSFLLEHLAFRILRKCFGGLEVYGDLVRIMQSVTFKTCLGQSADTLTGRGRQFNDYTDTRYHFVATYKTSYYTAYLPVALAMTFSRKYSNCKIDMQTWKTVKQITLDIGKFFQVQDDYMDCYGDAKTIGKTGTDIQEGKCTWLFVTAKNLCTSAQYKQLEQNYGLNAVTNVSAVKELYTEIGIPEIFRNYQESTKFEITECIGKLQETNIRLVLSSLLDKISSRTH